MLLSGKGTRLPIFELHKVNEFLQCLHLRDKRSHDLVCGGTSERYKSRARKR